VSLLVSVHCCPVKDPAKAGKHAGIKAIRIEMDFYDLNSILRFSRRKPPGKLFRGVANESGPNGLRSNHGVPLARRVPPLCRSVRWEPTRPVRRPLPENLPRVTIEIVPAPKVARPEAGATVLASFPPAG